MSPAPGPNSSSSDGASPAQAGGASNETFSAAQGGGEYVVQDGDSIESIAFQKGLFWETIWNDPQNESVKTERKSPNHLMPGDKLHVREIETKEESGATEQKHRFKRKGVPSCIHLQFMDEGKPRANQKYVLTVDGEKKEGSTDGDGMVSLMLSPAARSASVVVGTDPGDEYELKLRALWPVSTVTGIQARLRSLGFYEGDIDGKIGPQTRAAIRLFQEEQKLDVDGIAGPQTQAKLKECYGS
ncbi:MAG: peptidoglycan-binding protein [Planctomycetota bacterium]|nr:peptidoglycan-binding protein [Planctomycetota bacterium]